MMNLDFDNMTREQMIETAKALRNNWREFFALITENNDQLNIARANGTATEEFMDKWIQTNLDLQNHMATITWALGQIAWTGANRAA